MLPKVQFTRSYIYDEHLVKDANFKMPSEKYIFRQIRRLDLKWQKVEKQVLSEMEKVTGLKWKEKHIYVYATAGVGAFSMPLTLSMKNDVDYMLDTLIHELIHRIFSENENWVIIKKRWLKLRLKYKKEHPTTSVHIPIHAVHQHIFLKIFDKKRLEKEWELCMNWPHYNRSWQIVKEEGFEKIIKQLNPKYRGL